MNEENTCGNYQGVDECSCFIYNQNSKARRRNDVEEESKFE